MICRYTYTLQVSIMKSLCQRTCFQRLWALVLSWKYVKIGTFVLLIIKLLLLGLRELKTEVVRDSTYLLIIHISWGFIMRWENREKERKLRVKTKKKEKKRSKKRAVEIARSIEGERESATEGEERGVGKRGRGRWEGGRGQGESEE